MAPRIGSRLGCVLVTGMLAVMVSACAPKPSGDTDKLQIQVGRFDVSVKNVTGRALFNVQVTVAKAGGATAYTRTIARLENAEVGECPFNTLTTEGGGSFSPRTTRVSTVTVTAKDINGAVLRAQIPWAMPK
jgi:hypothetical protein